MVRYDLRPYEASESIVGFRQAFLLSSPARRSFPRAAPGFVVAVAWRRSFPWGRRLACRAVGCFLIALQLGINDQSDSVAFNGSSSIVSRIA